MARQGNALEGCGIESRTSCDKSRWRKWAGMLGSHADGSSRASEVDRREWLG